MNIRLVFVLCCLLIPPAPLLADPAPDGLKLFLLIGQSNMAGRGKVEPQDQQTNPHIFVLTQDLQWTLAKDPLHFDKPKLIGVGPGMEFARTVAKSNPNANLGLIPCAVGGTRLDEWKPGGKLYTDAVTRAREAMKKGKLSGILWHQGEGEFSPELIASYPVRFAAMIAQLRTDLHAETVPVVLGEIGRFYKSGPAFNTMVPEATHSVPRCSYVTTEDLTDKGDHTHFTAQSQRTLGQRYAAAYLKLTAAPESAPAR